MPERSDDDWQGLNLSPAAGWRGGRRRVGVAAGPDGIWMADVDPGQRHLRALLHHPLTGIASPSGLATAAAAGVAAMARALEAAGNVIVALGPGVITGLQEIAPVSAAQVAEALLQGGLSVHAIWEDAPPVLAARTVSSTATSARVLYAGNSGRTFAAWRQTLSGAGLNLDRIEPFAWDVLRGLVATGDIVPGERWGLAIVSQGRCWISLWEHDELVLWRETMAPRLKAVDLAAAADFEEVLTVARTIKAAWRFAGISTAQGLWVVADDSATAEALAEMLVAENVAAAVPAHAGEGQLGQGGAAALAALGAACADSLPFPGPLGGPGEAARPISVALPSFGKDHPRARKVAAALLGASALVGVLGYCLFAWLSGPTVVTEKPSEAVYDVLSSKRQTARTDWPLARILDQVRKNIPQDAWLKNLDVGADGQVVLEGESMGMRSPLLFSLNLDRLPGWERVQLASLEASGSVYVFKVQARLDRQGLVPPPGGKP